MLNRFAKSLLPLLGLFVGSSSSNFGMTLDQQIQARSQDNFDEARFRLWLPEKVEYVRGIFVLVPGLQSNGLDLINDPRWQLLAAKFKFGLLGCLLRDRRGAYYIAAQGTGRALLDALEQLSGRSNHPEIRDAPLAMWGYSAGGQFTYNFTCWAPNRVVSFIAVKGGYYDASTDSRSRKVPALFFAGEKDEILRIQNITRVFETNRRRGALWCLAIEPNEGHVIGRTVDIALTFFDAVVARRLSADGSRKSRLHRFNESGAWLGNLISHEVASASAFSQPADTAVWLPDETTALKWREFMTRKDLLKADEEGSAETTALSRVWTAVPAPIVKKMTPAVVAVVLIVAALMFLSIRLHKRNNRR